MQMYCSYRCAVTQHQCTATLFRAKCNPHCVSAALQHRLASGLYHCNHTYELFLFIQKCSDPTPVPCNTVLCKMQCPQLSAALQDRLAASLYHCNYTCENLLFIQKCSDPTPVPRNTVQGKMQTPQLSAALQDRLAASLYHCNYTCGKFLFAQVCSEPSQVYCSLQNAVPTAQCCSARQACSRLVSLQLHL